MGIGRLEGCLGRQIAMYPDSGSVRHGGRGVLWPASQGGVLAWYGPMLG
jgi:hypothetical protein